MWFLVSGERRSSGISRKIMMRWSRDSELWEKDPRWSPACRSSTGSTWSTARLIRRKWKRWGRCFVWCWSSNPSWFCMWFVGGFVVLLSFSHLIFLFCLTVWPVLYARHVDGSQGHHGSRTSAKDCQWLSTAGFRWNRKCIIRTYSTAQQINNLMLQLLSFENFSWLKYCLYTQKNISV